MTSQVAIVTGGSRGIGRAVAEALAAQGALVVAMSRSAGQTCSSVIVGRCVDVADDDSVKEAVSDVVGEHGRIDILVNGAGVTLDRLIVKMSVADFDKVLTTNLRGSFCMTKSVVPHMMAARYGRIVNVASIAGVYGNVGQANYSASKAGLIGLTRSLGKELARFGVTCNAVAPGFIETDMTANIRGDAKASWIRRIPMRRFGTAEEVAAAVQYFCSEGAAYTTGQVLEVGGGLAL